MRWKGAICSLAWVAGCLTTGGQSYYVSHWGSNVPPYATWETAATNLMDAVNAAPEGATVWVTNGVYRTGSAPGGGLEGRLVLTRPVEVRSVNGPSNTFIEGATHAPETVLGPAAVRGVYMTHGLLDGFTIRRGATDASGDESAVSGGGLYAGGGTQLNIRVLGNAGHTAGGAWLERCTLSNALFRLNTSVTGPRVKLNRQVRLLACTIDNAPRPSPDLKILGTNGTVIPNGAVEMDAGNGAWFGQHHVATGSASQVFTITNSGTRPLMVTGISHQGGQTADFSILSPTTGVLQSGETMPLEVRFDPEGRGLRRALLYVQSNDTDDTPYALWLGGDGLQYEMLVLGTDGSWIENGAGVPQLSNGTDFGSYAEAPIVRQFTVTNAGTLLLTLTGTPRVAIGGADPGDFVVVQQPVESIAPGSVTEFSIRFSPMVATTRTAEVQIHTDDLYHTNGLYQFSIQGTCAPTNSFIDVHAGISAVGGSAMAWGDFDNDGRLDLGMLGYDGTNRITDLYRNESDGTFTRMVAGLVPLESGRLAWGDYNNDGWLDLAVLGVTTNGVVSRIYRNEGDGTFTDIQAGLPGVLNGGLAWGDYDNDGDLDLVLTGYTLSTSVARVYRNNGDGTFTHANLGLLAVQNSRAAWVDVDQSGWLDLIVTGDAATGKTARLYRNVSGVLSNFPASGLGGSAYGGLAIGDFNNDSLPDIAITGYGNSGMMGQVYRFGGTSSIYALTTNSIEAQWLGSAEWGDFNNSGWLDLVTSGENAASRRAVSLYTNRNGTLSVMPVQIPGMRISSVALGDADGDGDLDLAVSGLGTNGYVGAIYRNLAPTPNAPPGAPSNLTASLTNGNEIVFSWDAASDDLTPASGLTYNLFVGTVENPVAIMSPHADLDTGTRQVVAMGNAQYRREWRLRYLPSGETLIWGVQAIDGAYLGGSFAVGPPIETELLPDLVVSALQVQGVPFQAMVTISNQGAAASTAPVQLSAWLHQPSVPTCGFTSEYTRSVGLLGVGASTNVLFDDLPSPQGAATNTFRVFVNSECDSGMLEIRMDNNQRTRVYTNRVNEAFWITAVALTNSVYVRWIDPVRIGMQSSEVMLRGSDTAYPATTSDGLLLYNGTNQVYHHTGRPPNNPNYYSIWVTHDGMEWFEPPE